MSDCLKGSAGGTASAKAGGKQQACTAEADGKKLAGAVRNFFLTKCVGS